MKNKKRLIVFSIIAISILTIISIVIYLNYQKNRNFIPDNYIAVFRGGSGELIYETYIYKIDNGHNNYGFKYINTKSMTTSWGSSNWETVVVKKGKVDWTDEVFGVAKEHGAYSYVRLPNDSKTYSIEEFMGMFIMN